jgi:small subunit ribosomal protein S13
MIYFLGKNLNEQKNLKLELKHIYGLNQKNINLIFNFLGINSTIQTKFLKKKIIKRLKEYLLTNYTIDSALKKIYTTNINFNLEIKTIKSLRKINGLPVNGQRTKTNAKTTKKTIQIKK